MRSKGLCDRSWCLYNYIYLYINLHFGTNLLSPKYSLSEVYFKGAGMNNSWVNEMLFLHRWQASKAKSRAEGSTSAPPLLQKSCLPVCTAMVTKNTHHLTSSGQDTFFTSSFSFHGHLLTLHSNYVKLWAGRTQEKLKFVSINEELGHSQLMRLPFYSRSAL